MEELVKYFEALEARIAALEAKQQDLQDKLIAVGEHVAAMVKTIEEVKQVQPAAPSSDKEMLLAQRLTILAERVEALENGLAAEPMVMPEPEPVVEEPEPVIEPEPLPIVEAEPEPVVEPEPVIEPEPQVEPEKKEEPVVAEPAQPQQTSLFGQAVSNIRQAISLGDRFLFQRELFAQNGEKMQKALDDIDKLASFDEAVAYIDKHFQWDKESSTYELFINILHRRFN
jgi:hypothetical protein